MRNRQKHPEWSWFKALSRAILRTLPCCRGDDIDQGTDNEDVRRGAFPFSIRSATRWSGISSSHAGKSTNAGTSSLAKILEDEHEIGEGEGDTKNQESDAGK
jgi:hypothetical protein